MHYFYKKAAPIGYSAALRTDLFQQNYYISILRFVKRAAVGFAMFSGSKAFRFSRHVSKKDHPYSCLQESRSSRMFLTKPRPMSKKLKKALKEANHIYPPANEPNKETSPGTVNGIRRGFDHYRPLRITPQAIFFPAFPAGCEWKSSGLLCITTVRPIISRTENRSVLTAKYAFPWHHINGGRSPACFGCTCSTGL